MIRYKNRNEDRQMDKNLILDIKAKVVSRMKSPYSERKDSGDEPYYIYHAYVDVNDLPSGIPTEVNPRETNMHTNVAKAIIRGLESDSEMFYLNNRGIFMSAESVSWRGNTLHVDLGNDKMQYGILDGGHTYRAILDRRNQIHEGIVQYVHLEIATKITELEPIDVIASSRNHSVQVNDKAIAELAGNFDFVKKAIKDEPYAKRIAYKQNQNTADFDIDATDLIRLMFAMNAISFPKQSLSQPIQAYSGKTYVLRQFLKSIRNEKDASPYYNLAHLLPSMVKLYNQIELDVPNAYKFISGKNARFGSVKGVEKRPSETKYFKDKTGYSISQGLLFPIFAGFRYLIQPQETGVLDWVKDPFELWEEVQNKLVNNTIEMSRSLGNNPQSTGKNASLWQQNYDAVKSQYLEDKE